MYNEISQRYNLDDKILLGENSKTKILKAEENIDEENYHENIQTVYLCIHPLFFPKMYKRGEGWV